jgi:hypothetical protein
MSLPSDSPPVATPAAQKSWPWYVKVLLGLALSVGAFLGYIAVQSPKYRVERSILIKAPAEAVFAEVNDFHAWQEWSPWAKLDPNATATFAGPEAGKGAIFKWSGNEKVGEGSMTMLDTNPPNQVQIRLEFLKPMAGTAEVEFILEQVGDNTKTTWRMDGENDFVGRCFCFFMNMDKMIGSDYEKGLAKIKEIVEQKQTAAAEPKETR